MAVVSERRTIRRTISGEPYSRVSAGFAVPFGRRLVFASPICATALLTAAAFLLPAPDLGRAGIANHEMAAPPTHMILQRAGAR